MAKAAKNDKPTKGTAKKYKEKVAIKGTFLDVFKVVKKDADKRISEKKDKR